MKTLALEFSSARRSVAVVLDHAVHELVETGPRSTDALGMIEGALRAAQIEREQIECVAVGVGPGSYTGIRSAIALAQGWKLARGTPLAALSSVACMAAQLRKDGRRGRVHVVVDAQRGEWYVATYHLSDGGVREELPLRIVAASEVLARRGAGELIAGPEASRISPEAVDVAPSAREVGRQALAHRQFVPADKLVPIYLRETSFSKFQIPGSRSQI